MNNPVKYEEQVDQAAAVLSMGGIVAIPTETVYGLAANAMDERAVAKIFAAKNRPEFDPLIVHISQYFEGEHSMLHQVVAAIPDAYRRLMARFWPGPLTLIFPKSDRVPLLVTSGLPTVAVRCPSHPVTQQLLQLTGIPLAAPSANLFGRTSPTCAEHVYEQLGDRVDLIINAGPCRVGVESTILRFHNDQYEIMRPGGITREDIEDCLGLPVVMTSAAAKGTDSLAAPGSLKEHYAPKTPLIISGAPDRIANSVNAALMTMTDPGPEIARNFKRVVVLSSKGDLTEAAAKFFAVIHELDAGGYQQIVATPLPPVGLGVALNDRLRRAAHQSIT